MKKIYSILFLMGFTSFLIADAQNQLKRSLNQEPWQTDINSISETAARSTTQNIVQRDSALTYSSTGNIHSKEYYIYKDEGRDITTNQYSLIDSTNTLALRLVQRTVYDNQGNIILSSSIFNPDAENASGRKSTYLFNEEKEKIASTHYDWSIHKKDWIAKQVNKKIISSNGYQMQLESYKYDLLDNIIDGLKTVSIADSTNLMKKEYSYRWNPIIKDWVDFEIVYGSDSVMAKDLGYTENIYIYDSQGRIKSQITNRIYKNSTEPIPERKTEMIYTEDGFMKERINYFMDAVANQDSTSTKDWQYLARELYEYDNRGNTTLYEQYYWNVSEGRWVKDSKIDSEFDERNALKLRVEHDADPSQNIWIPIRKTVYALDSAFRRELDEIYLWVGNSIDNGFWQGQSRNISRYTNDLVTYTETQRWDEIENNWTLFLKSTSELDENGNESVYKSYEWRDGEWSTSYIKIFYPYAPQQDIEIEETKPINNDVDSNNYSGKFTLTLNLASNAIPSGSIDIIMPEGLSLDLEASRLSPDLASMAQATFTEKDNNIWTVTISERALRSASNNLVYKNILDVAYTVNEGAAVKKHEIVLKNIELALSTGGVISKNELKVAVTPKNMSSLEEKTETIDVYIANGYLNIDTPFNEVISIYSLTGQVLLKTTKQGGAQSFDSQILKKGLVVVNGSSGWNRKLLIQ